MPFSFLALLASLSFSLSSHALLDEHYVEHGEIEAVFELCKDHEHQAICYRRELKSLMGQELLDEDQYPQAPQYPTHNIQGSFESYSFNFDFSTRREFFSKCRVQWKKSGHQKVDDIAISFNFNSVENKRNGSSFWRTGLEVCTVVYEEIERQNRAVIEDVEQEGFDIAMTIESSESIIYQNIKTPREFTHICTQFYTSTGYSKADDASILINNRTFRKFRNGASFWRSAIEMCSVFREIINF